MSRCLQRGGPGLALVLLIGLSLTEGALAQAIPALKTVSATVATARPDLVSHRAKLVSERAALREASEAHNAQCRVVVEGTPQDAACDAPRFALEAAVEGHAAASRAFNADVAAAAKVQESAYFYALQTGALSPMPDQGHPIDAPGALSTGLHGLVGGTTWTFGFRWPHGSCAGACEAEVKRRLQQQLALFCSSQADPQKCVAAGLPFTAENYDLVVSMASHHTPLEDLATRAIWDGVEFGEFSRSHKEIFAALTDRQFDVLDCHSNGAMLCLAALRSGQTTAKEVRLFGPQINAVSAALWRDYAAVTGAKVSIYINAGDPVPAAAWSLPAPQSQAGKAATAAWIKTPIGLSGTVAKTLVETVLDGATGAVDRNLKSYGFAVTRFAGCKDRLSIACHSMLLYEQNLAARGGAQ